MTSHVTGDFAPEQMHAVTEQYAERGTVFVGRSRGAITGLFNGREPLDPGSCGFPTGARGTAVLRRMPTGSGVTPASPGSKSTGFLLLSGRRVLNAR